MKSRACGFQRGVATLIAVAFTMQPIGLIAQDLAALPQAAGSQLLVPKALRLGCPEPAQLFAAHFTFQPTTDADLGRTQGRADAEKDTSGFPWLAFGCAAPVPGLVVAYVIKPDPPAQRLLGKSPEYIAAYTDAWQEGSKKKRTKNAWIGAGIGLVITIIYVAAVVSSENFSSFDGSRVRWREEPRW